MAREWHLADMVGDRHKRVAFCRLDADTYLLCKIDSGYGFFTLNEKECKDSFTTARYRDQHNHLMTLNNIAKYQKMVYLLEFKANKFLAGK